MAHLADIYLMSYTSKYTDNDDYVSVREPPEFLKDKLKRLLGSDNTSDCSFILKDPNTGLDVVIKAHQFQLAMASPFFSDMFYKDFKDYNIPIDGVEPRIFEKFLEVAYIQEPEIESPMEAVALYNVCRRFNIKDGVKYVQDWIKAHSNPKNAIILYECAKDHGDRILEEKCLQQFSENTLEVLGSEYFSSARPEVVNRIFKMETLTVHSERDLLKALDCYLAANAENHFDLRIDLKEALYSIRFLTLDINDILQTDVLTDEEKVTILKDFRGIKPVTPETLPHFSLERLPRFNVNEFESNLRAVICSKIVNGKNRLMVNPSHWNRIEPDDRKKVLNIIKTYQHEMLQLYERDDCLVLREIFRKHDILGVHKGRSGFGDESRVVLKTPESSPDHKVFKYM